MFGVLLHSGMLQAELDQIVSERNTNKSRLKQDTSDFYKARAEIKDSQKELGVSPIGAGMVAKAVDVARSTVSDIRSTMKSSAVAPADAAIQKANEAIRGM